jgi:molecular chaperone GrpE
VEAKLTDPENSSVESETETAAREDKLSELDILKQSLEEKKRAAEDYYNQLLRLKAEFENYRRRTEREKHNHLNWGKEEILLKQVAILDVLEQAAASTQTTTNIESIKQGLELIKQEFVKMLSSEGIVEIDCLNKVFDPSLHEAVEQVESIEPEGTIIEVMQKGYTLKDKLVRPARVKVAKPIEQKQLQN